MSKTGQFGKTFMVNVNGHPASRFTSGSPILAGIKSSRVKGGSTKEDTYSNTFNGNELPSLNDRSITIRYGIFHSAISEIKIY